MMGGNTAHYTHSSSDLSLGVFVWGGVCFFLFQTFDNTHVCCTKAKCVPVTLLNHVEPMYTFFESSKIILKIKAG